MKNLRNLQDKHIIAYIQYRQSEEVAPKTLKNDLGAIRYMHSFVPRAKHKLSSNEELKQIYNIDLEKTPSIKGDRAWTEKEYNDMLRFSKQIIENRNSEDARTALDFSDVIRIAKTMGLRVTEAVAMARSQAEEALRTGIYQVKDEAKNGKWRKVPLSNEARNVLERRLRNVPRGGRIFIKPNEKTHEAVNRVEKFLYNHRKKIETNEGRILRTWKNDKGEEITNELTFHGLRYNYIQQRMQQEINSGFSKKQAASRVTKEVGHERTGVINVYLGGK